MNEPNEPIHSKEPEFQPQEGFSLTGIYGFPHMCCYIYNVYGKFKWDKRFVKIVQVGVLKIFFVRFLFIYFILPVSQ